MKRFLLCLMMIFGITMAALACPCTGDDSPCKCPPGCECNLNVGERVNDLPEDGKKWYISVFSDNPEHDKWFVSDSHLKHLKGQVHYRWYGSRSAEYKERYAKSTPVLPCIRLQDSTGQVVYNVKGKDVPGTSRELSYGLFDAIREHRTQALQKNCGPNRNCPNNNCRPAPAPAPVDPDPQPLTPDEIPTISPDEAPLSSNSDMPPLWGLALAGLVGALGSGGKMLADKLK